MSADVPSCFWGWEDKTEKDVTEMVWDVVILMQLAQDRYQWRAVMNTVMNLRFP
jgi:hypothetical protein